MGGEERLAQLNIARLAYERGDPRLAEFMDNLARVNAVAERSPGFIWRFVDDGGASATEAVFDPADPRVLPNLSVWASPEDLERFVWRTVHRRFVAKRGEWFAPMTPPYQVMWRLEAERLPDLDEAREKLQDMRRNGPSERAFGWERFARATVPPKAANAPKPPRCG